MVSLDLAKIFALHNQRVGVLFVRKGRPSEVQLVYKGENIGSEEALQTFFQLWSLSCKNPNSIEEDQDEKFPESICDAMVCLKIIKLRKTLLTHGR